MDLFRSDHELITAPSYFKLKSSIEELQISTDDSYVEIKKSSLTRLKQPSFSSLGASADWIERHSDTCICSDNLIINSHTPTILLKIANARMCPLTNTIITSNQKALAESHHNEHVYKWIANRNQQLTSDGKIYLYLPFIDISDFFEIEEPVFIVNTRWSSTNYYHWLHEAFPRLIFFINNVFSFFPNLKLVWLGQKDDLKPYHIESLNLLKISTNNLTFVSSRYIFKNLIHLSFLDPGNITYFQANIISRLASSKNHYADLKYEKTLVLRKNNSNRFIEDKELINSLISKYSFTPVFLESMSLAEQFSIFKYSKVLISAHGAALANLVVSNQLNIIELMPADSIHPIYWQIASCSNCNYTMIPSPLTNLRKQSMRPNKILLETVLNQLFKVYEL